MSLQDDHEQERNRVLRELITTFSPPNAVHPVYVQQVLTYAADLLSARQERLRETDRPRMPTLMWPRSAAFEVPDPPPVPPAAL